MYGSWVFIKEFFSNLTSWKYINEVNIVFLTLLLDDKIPSLFLLYSLIIFLEYDILIKRALNDVILLKNSNNIFPFDWTGEYSNNMCFLWKRSNPSDIFPHGLFCIVFLMDEFIVTSEVEINLSESKNKL